MKNLKKIARQNLKSITEGRPPAASECIASGCLTSAY
ncbi:MAG: bacteriocin-like protein [Chryseobacterium culicis]